MFCKNCGAKLDDDAMFCDKCGTVIRKDAADEVNGKKNAQTQLDSIETGSSLDEQSESGMTPIKKKKTIKLWIAVSCFIISGASFVMTIIKYVRQYNIEKKAYDIVVKVFMEEGGYLQEIFDSLGFKTPNHYALNAIIKSPFPYITVVALIMGLVWLAIKNKSIRTVYNDKTGGKR